MEMSLASALREARAHARIICASPMQLTLSDRQVSYLRVLLTVVLLAGALCFVVSTLRWQWTWDTQVMHYIVLLLKRGWVPYKDIYDLNMPGCYLTERWAIGIFGGGDLGWRFYEFTLLGAMALAMMVIAAPGDWLAGLFAAVTFAIIHGNEGAGMAAERDEVMTVLLLGGYALMFLAMRRRWPALMLPFGLAVGIAILIKPTVMPFAAVLLLLVFFVLRRQGRPAAAYLLFGLAGFAVALGLLLNFLLPHHAFGPFFFMLRKTVPFYSRLEHATWGKMLRASLPWPFLVYAPIAVLLAATARRRVPFEANAEMWAVRLGICFGGFTYFVQRKGYFYHRYTLLAFALLWVGMELTAAMKHAGWRRNLGALGLGTAVLLFLPPQANLLRHDRHPTNPIADQLEEDLARLGGGRLDGQVQCLDVVEGCYSALYRMDLAPSTGFMGDLQFFVPSDGDVVPYYRRIFWEQIHQRPPQAIILSSEWFAAPHYSFAKLGAWPELRGYLDSAYDLATTRSCGSRGQDPIAYRIYVLKGSAAERLLGPAAPTLPAPDPAFGCT